MPQEGPEGTAREHPKEAQSTYKTQFLFFLVLLPPPSKWRACARKGAARRGERRGAAERRGARQGAARSAGSRLGTVANASGDA